MTDRFVNNLKRSDNLNVRLRSLKTLQSKQMFFLGGFIKSGTTWVERLLDSHPEIACKGEAHFVSLLEPAMRAGIAGYNNAIPDKGNWSRLTSEGIHNVSASEYSYTENDFDNIFSLTMQLLMSKWCNDNKLIAVGEKTPNNARFFKRLLQLFPDARFIYIIRDVRDVIVSGWFFNIALNARSAMSKFNSIHQYGVFIAQNWVQEVANALKFVKLENDKAMIVKYENLWHEPKRYMEELLNFLDVQSSDELVDLCLRRTEFSRLSGGRNRGIENRSSFYRKGVIGDWKNHLKHETLVEIETYCGAMLDHLGYAQYQP